MVTVLIDDDMNETADVRRGKTSWYKVKGMEHIAQHDAIIMENACYLILNRFFGHLPCYSGMIKTINEAYMISLMGQTIELLLNRPLKNQTIERYSMEKYDSVTIMIGSYYRFYMPIALTMLLAG